MVYLIATATGMIYVCSQWRNRPNFIKIKTLQDGKYLLINKMAVISIQKVTEKEAQELAQGKRLVAVEPKVKGITLQ